MRVNRAQLRCEHSTLSVHPPPRTVRVARQIGRLMKIPPEVVPPTPLRTATSPETATRTTSTPTRCERRAPEPLIRGRRRRRTGHDITRTRRVPSEGGWDSAGPNLPPRGRERVHRLWHIRNRVPPCSVGRTGVGVAWGSAASWRCTGSPLPTPTEPPLRGRGGTPTFSPEARQRGAESGDQPHFPAAAGSPAPTRGVFATRNGPASAGHGTRLLSPQTGRGLDMCPAAEQYPTAAFDSQHTPFAGGNLFLSATNS